MTFAATRDDMLKATELPGNMDDHATPLLTICIPTHNREVTIGECLASVLPQAEALGVGVCVSDNGSSDGTWQALEAVKRQYPWMQIMRHTRDIGFRDNLTGAVLSSHAQYVWPIGDKLVLIPGALKYVVGELVQRHPDVVIVNTPGRVVSSVEKVYSASQDCLTDVGWWTTLCGATVLPRQAFVDALRVQPLNKDFPHVVALFSYLASLHAPHVLFAGRVLIEWGKSAGDNHVESSYADRTLEVWGRNWYDAVMSLPVDYSVHDKLQTIRSFSEHTTCLRLEHLMHLRVQGELTFERLRADQVRLRVAISTPWWLAVVISLVPQWMLRLLLRLHPRRLLRAVRRRLGLR